MTTPTCLTALTGSGFTPVDLQPVADSEAQREAWKAMEESIADYWDANGSTKSHWEETGRRFWTWSAPQLRVGPIPFRTASIRG